MSWKNLQQYDCDRCGTTYKKTILKKQRGMLVCSSCLDSSDKEYNIPNVKWNSPRSNSSSITPVTEPRIFTVGTTGITALAHSQTTEYGRNFVMFIVSSGGAVNVTANPQITAGTLGDMLTLRGTSDTDTILIDTGDGVSLNGPSCLLRRDDVLSLVFDGTNWVETSRGSAI